MLQVISTINNETVISVIPVDDYRITYEYDGGEYVDFDIGTDDPIYKQITERALIVSESNNYIVTKIDGNSQRYVHVSAEVDRRAFQAVFYENYDNGSRNLTNAITQPVVEQTRTIPAILPSGWTFVNNGNTTNMRTLRLEHGTALDLLNNCAALWDVRFTFNAKTKTLTAVNPDAYEQSAAFVTEELNLKALQYYGDGVDVITRLEARGKDGLTFSDINGGKSYVENYQYTTDVIYGYWQDERYTVKEDLLADAQAKLAEMSKPQRSYECSVIDLKSIDPDKYSAFDLSLYQKIALKDVSRETSYVYQVVKVVSYPNYPERNVITLSTSAPKITAKLQDIETEVADFDGKIEGATSWMTDSEGGAIYFVRDPDGNIIAEVLKVGDGDNPPVWVRNKNGIGYAPGGYGTAASIAMTADGNVVANTMTTGLITGGSNVEKKHIELHCYDANNNEVSSDSADIAVIMEVTVIDGVEKQVIIDLNQGTLQMLDVETGAVAFSFDGTKLTVGTSIETVPIGIPKYQDDNNSPQIVATTKIGAKSGSGTFAGYLRAMRGLIVPPKWQGVTWIDTSQSVTNAQIKGAPSIRHTITTTTNKDVVAIKADYIYFDCMDGTSNCFIDATDPNQFRIYLNGRYIT